MLKIWEEVIAYPDIKRTWIVPATTRGKDLLKKYHFDAIISSSSPASAHLVAAHLAAESKLPWVQIFETYGLRTIPSIIRVSETFLKNGLNIIRY